MWLTEDPWPLMLLCGLASLVCLGLWSASRRAVHIGGAILCCVAGGVIYAVEAAIVTPAERVEAQVRQLVGDFRRKDAATLTHFSDSAADLKLMCQTAMALVQVDDDYRLTDFHTQVTNNGSRATCVFRVNATLNVQGFGNVGRQPGRFELTWAREGDAWKVVRVKRLHPIKDEEMSVLERSAG